MNQLRLQNHTQTQVKKVGRKVRLPMSTLSIEDRLNSIADIIIERILEERNKASAA
ncbi:hypothetical protein KKE78_05070 [Patescibacteria group bacterium]|nr:hypothetical protein [Patescibacteria group bacterium]